MKLDNKAPLGVNALAILRPNGGWSITDSNFESIAYDDTCVPVTKEEFDNAAKQVPDAIKKQEQDEHSSKLAVQAKLEALGLTVEDLRVLGLG